MPRTTSQVTDTEFPFAEDTTPFILVHNFTDESSFHAGEVGEKDADRGYGTAWTLEKKRALLEQADRLQAVGVACSLLAVWPGAEQSHVFLVDDLSEARVALA